MAYRVVYRDSDGVPRETYACNEEVDSVEDELEAAGNTVLLSEYVLPEEVPGYEPPSQERL